MYDTSSVCQVRVQIMCLRTYFIQEVWTVLQLLKLLLRDFFLSVRSALYPEDIITSERGYLVADYFASVPCNVRAIKDGHIATSRIEK